MKDYVQQPIWKFVVSSANISYIFFYCNFLWLCNLGGGNCSDESLFPVLFSVMMHQNNCQYNVRLEISELLQSCVLSQFIGVSLI